MKDIEISVVMSVHNADICPLKESIESILNQSFQNYEFIIVNDINSSEVNNYLTHVDNNNTNIRLILNKLNIGLTKSLIKAIDISNGKYIARQDSDDLSSINRLEIQHNYLKSNKDVVLLGTAYAIDYGGSNQKNILPPLDHKDIVSSFLRQNPFVHSSVIFDKGAYFKTGGYNKDCKYGQDFDLWPKFIKYGTLKNISDNLVTRRLSNDSVSLKYSVHFYQTLNGMRVRMRERKMFKENLIFLKIIFVGIKQHLSFYLNFLKIKK